MTSLIIALTLVVAILNIFLANYIFYENRFGVIYRLIAILCLDLAVFSFCSYMFYSLQSSPTVNFWDHLRTIVYLFLFPISFHFTWYWIGRGDRQYTPWLLAIFYTFTGFLAVVSLSNSISDKPLINDLGIWVTSDISSPWKVVAIAWSALVDIAIMTLAIQYMVSLKKSDQRRNHLLIFSGLIIPVTVGFLLSVLQKLSNPDLPSLIPFYILIGNLLIIYGIVRNRTYLLTPQFAWREIMIIISDAIMLVDPQGLILAINPALLELTGYLQKDLENKHLSILFPEAASDIPEMFSELLSTSGQKNIETVIQAKDGRMINVLLSYSLIRSHQNRLFGIAFILTDITRLRKTESQLQQTLSVLNATIESIPSGVLVVDRHNMVIAYNQKFLNLWQLPDSWPKLTNYRERRTTMASRTRDPQAYLTRIEELFANLEMNAVDLIETKDGRFIESTAQPYRVFDQIVGKVFSYQDITQRRQVEEEQRNAHAITEVLSSTGTAMSSTLDIDQVLDSMLVQLGKVVPYDTITILTIKDGEASPIRAMGYERFGDEAVKTTLAFTFKIDTTPNLKWMFETHQPLVIPDIQTYPGWVITPNAHMVHSWVGAPMQAHGEAIAFLSLNKIEPDFYTLDHARYLDIFASQAGLAMENARLFAEVKLLAVTDPLTGLSNRRSFLELAEAAYTQARRYERPLSVIMVDIDQFKKVNDRFGHFVGDYFLKNIGLVFLDRLRQADVKGRFGGEEFMFLLPETRLVNAVRLAERLRSQVANLRLKVESGYLSITVSIGVTSLQGDENITLEALLIRADEAMYIAKESGGNCVHIWQPKNIHA